MTKRPCLVTVLLVIVTKSAFSDDSLPDRFRRDAPKAWSEYLARTEHLQGRFKDVVAELSPNARTVLEGSCEFEQRPGCALMMQQVTNLSESKPTTRCRLWAYNPSYAFSLERLRPERPWAISGIQTDLSDGIKIMPGGQAPNPKNHLRSPVEIAYVDKASLPELISNPDFTVTKVAAVKRGKRSLARVEFHVSRPTSTNRGVLKSGWLLLDPEFLWVQRQNQLHIEWAPKSKASAEFAVATTFDYQEHAAPFPILQKVTEERTTTTAGGDRERMRWTFTFDLTEGDAPEPDFTLTKFGFPEPRNPSRATKWYVWVAVGGIGCLLLAIWLRKRGWSGTVRTNEL